MMGNGNSFRNRNKESNGYGSLEREEDENPYDDDEDELYTSHSIHAGHSTDTDANTVPGYSRGNENNVAFTPSSSVDMVYRTLRGIGCCFGTCIFIFIFICLFSYLSSHIDTSISSPIRHYNPHHSFVNHNDGGGSYSYSYSDSDSDRFDGTGADDAVAHTRSNRLHHNHNDNRADVGSGSTVRADEMSAIDFENAIGWLMLLLYFCVRCRTFFYLCKHEVLGLKYRRYILEMICLSCYVFAVLLRCHPGHTQPTTLNALSPSSAPISLSSSLGYPVYTTTGRTMYGDDDNHASYGYNDDTDADIDVSGPGEGEGEGLPFTSEQTPRLPSPFSRHFSRHLPWIFDALLAMLFNAFVLCRFLFHKYCDSSEERGRLIKVGSLHSVVMSEFNDHEHKVSIHDHRRKHSDQYGGGRTRAYDSDSSNDEEYRVDFSPIHFSQSPIQRGGRGEPPPPHMHMHMHTHGGNGTTSLDSSMHSTASGMGGRPLVGPSLDDSGLLYSSGNHPTTSSANDSFVGFSRM